MPVTRQPLHPDDAATLRALRPVLRPLKGAISGPDARGVFDAMTQAIPAAHGVTHRPDTIADIPGLWCLPATAEAATAEPATTEPSRAVLWLHGGAYVIGSAAAYRNFVGQCAARAKLACFVPEYRLAPEHPFPAAFDDARAVHRALAARIPRLALAGDSAGGGLALALLADIARDDATPNPCGAAVLSPWTDLALTGDSLETRAESDPLLTREAVAAAAPLYVGRHATTDPRISPLHADLSALPPIRIDVGDHEILLDDSLRFAEGAAASGTDITLVVWDGMPHVFAAQLGRLGAAAQVLDAVALFLRGITAPVA